LHLFAEEVEILLEGYESEEADYDRSVSVRLASLTRRRTSKRDVRIPRLGKVRCPSKRDGEPEDIKRYAKRLSSYREVNQGKRFTRVQDDVPDAGAPWYPSTYASKAAPELANEMRVDRHRVPEPLRIVQIARGRRARCEVPTGVVLLGLRRGMLDVVRRTMSAG
jgi:hypothetical protein